MGREIIINKAFNAIDSNNKHIVLELATGVGKTKIAIDMINRICDRVYNNTQESTNILIVIAKRIHQQTWLDEINKWGGIKSDNIIFSCYNSLHKYKGRYFDVIVYDEAQHLSPSRIDTINNINVNESSIYLSATIGKELRQYLMYAYRATFIKYDIKNAINDNILPEPKIILLPLHLDNTIHDCLFNNKYGNKVKVTQKSYYDLISMIIEKKKQLFYNTRNEYHKVLWLTEAGKRLKWLSELKNNILKQILHILEHDRTITFCSSIRQSIDVGSVSINSNDNKKIQIKKLVDFNNKKYNHISSCTMLNESANLVDCKYAIFGNLMSSEIAVIQRIGRALRHKSPVLIIPYYVGTRDEDLMKKMIENCSKNKIISINNINQLYNIT